MENVHGDMQAQTSLFCSRNTKIEYIYMRIMCGTLKNPQFLIARKAKDTGNSDVSIRVKKWSLDEKPLQTNKHKLRVKLIIP